ncbi:hypothetical protein E0H73_13530 [Kribbella pittospori]|uniref:Tetracyclin repressor-like C-terminal domain-containing protein n=1 Tax=Kribbella pittospori TaxID=722689 RepID=A0A4R0KRA8_9ACTN|nr:hypothetical protein [Kribbella pittospori]TCC63453.1 hypothetical protein E0H73_13530 [Kribbella pittospori]
MRNLDSPEQLASWTQSLVVALGNHISSTQRATKLPPAAIPDGCGEDARRWLLHTWEDLTAGFARLQRNQLLLADVDPAVLATAFLAAIQGGYLLSVTARNITPLKIAADMALQQVARSLAER